LRERKLLFWICLVEAGVVDAHPKLSASLGDDYRVSQPLWVIDISDEANIEQLLDLLTDEVLPPKGLFLRFMLDWSGVGVNL
jgi:hypothetical protein